jgi:signal transduction histidine kinase
VAGLCDRAGKEGGIRCGLSWPAPEDFSLDRTQEINHYRIIQEALQNALKHSRAAEARVELRVEEGFLRVRISDNGRGFPKGTGPSRERREGLGIRSMEYRAHQLGAEYRLDSRPGSTVVELRMPLPGT